MDIMNDEGNTKSDSLPVAVPSNDRLTRRNSSNNEHDNMNDKAQNTTFNNSNDSTNNSGNTTQSSILTTKFVFYEPHEKLSSDNDNHTDRHTPHKFDILCGRDKVCHNHIGNHRFRVIIEMYRIAYQTAPSKEEKMRITKEIVTNVTSNGFRFLKKIGGGGAEHDEWTELDEAMARDKVSHALRGAKDPHQQQQSKRKSQSRRRSSSNGDGAVTTAVSLSPTPLNSPLLPSSAGPVNITSAMKRFNLATTAESRRKRTTSEDSSGSASTSGSEGISSDEAPGAAIKSSTPSKQQQQQVQQPQVQQQFPLTQPPPPSAMFNTFMSTESIRLSLQSQGSLQLDDEQHDMLVNDLSKPPTTHRDTNTTTMSRQQRLLELSVRNDESFRLLLPPGGSSVRSSFEETPIPRLPQREEPPQVVPTNPADAPPLPNNVMVDKSLSPPVMPIGVISDEDDEDEPPTISEIMNDTLLREALLDSMRQQKVEELARQINNNNYSEYVDDEQDPTSMFDSTRSVEMFMSMISQQPMIESTRSVDAIMAFHSQQQQQQRQLYEDHKPQSIQPEDASSFSPFGMTVAAGAAGAQQDVDDDNDDDDEEEPPTIADLMNDNMLCEALLGSLRLDPYKSHDDIMSSLNSMEKTSP